MTVALAQAAAQSLRTALLDNGVRAVSIELQQGVAGAGWHAGTFKRGMGHHIASRPSQGLTPGLATVKNGRGGANPLTGPLANGYGGYDLVARIITMAWANHPGAGGPWSVPGWGTIPANNGRPYIFGWEFEGGYEPYTDEMHDFMARCGAGTLDWLGNAPLECWDEHKGWAGPRKPDRIGYTTASGRSRIAAVRNDNGGIPMPLDQGTKNDISVIVKDWVIRVLRDEKLLDWPAESGGPQSVVSQLKLDAQGLAAVYRELADLKVAQPATGAAQLPTEFDLPNFAREIARQAALEVVAEQDRRARDGDPATGPIS